MVFFWSVIFFLERRTRYSRIYPHHIIHLPVLLFSPKSQKYPPSYAAMKYWHPKEIKFPVEFSRKKSCKDFCTYVRKVALRHWDSLIGGGELVIIKTTLQCGLYVCISWMRLWPRQNHDAERTVISKDMKVWIKDTQCTFT